MSFDFLLGSLVAVFIFAYLIYALIRPEHF